jgi:hypothetical protein
MRLYDESRSVFGYCRYMEHGMNVTTHTHEDSGSLLGYCKKLIEQRASMPLPDSHTSRMCKHNFLEHLDLTAMHVKSQTLSLLTSCICSCSKTWPGSVASIVSKAPGLTLLTLFILLLSACLPAFVPGVRYAHRAVMAPCHLTSKTDKSLPSFSRNHYSPLI